MRQSGPPALHARHVRLWNRSHGSDVSWTQTQRPQLAETSATPPKYDPCCMPIGAVGREDASLPTCLSPCRLTILYAFQASGFESLPQTNRHKPRPRLGGAYLQLPTRRIRPPTALSLCQSLFLICRLSALTFDLSRKRSSPFTCIGLGPIIDGLALEEIVPRPHIDNQFITGTRSFRYESNARNTSL